MKSSVCHSLIEITICSLPNRQTEEITSVKLTEKFMDVTYANSLVVPDGPRGEVEEQLDDLEGHGDGDAQVEAEGAPYAREEPVALQKKKYDI